MMRKASDLAPWMLVAVLGMGLFAPAQAAQSQTCRLELSAAESRWTRLRSVSTVTETFQQKVTGLLLKAVELRHQAKIKDCLDAVAKAKTEMDQWERAQAGGSEGKR